MSDATDEMDAVQINLDVLALDAKTRANSLFRQWNLSFLSLSRYRTPVQDALQGEVTAAMRLGAYLHMTLPRRLRTAEGDVFPLIPNRWLVVRALGGGGGDPETAKSVILESDCPGDDGTLFVLTPKAEAVLKNSLDSLRNQYARHANTLGETGTLRQIKLGKEFPLEEWSERAENDVFLTASENGDSMFSAYAFRNRNILSYFDPLDDVASPSVVNYYVVGWLSSDQKSPPYFASSTGIQWNSAGGIPGDPYVRTYEKAPVNVAVGPNANEALLALMEQKLKLAGIADAGSALFSFAALLGDYTADMEKSNAETIAASNRQTACFSCVDAALRFDSEQGESGKLIEINRLCEKMESLRRSVMTKREELWLDFWRFHFFDFIPSGFPNATGRRKEEYEKKLKAENGESPMGNSGDSIHNSC